MKAKNIWRLCKTYGHQIGYPILKRKLPRSVDILIVDFPGPDVGPITRQISTRNGDVFDDPHRLTLLGELVRRQVAERAVWSALIVVQAPRFDLGLRVGDRRELVHIQALVPEPPIERLDERVFNGLPGANEVELHAAAIRPVFERPRLELGAVIHGDGARPPASTRTATIPSGVVADMMAAIT